MSEYKLKKELRIAISGKSGCGNTTVSTLLAEKLGVSLINYTFRQLAAEKGMTLKEVIESAKTDDSYDRWSWQRKSRASSEAASQFGCSKKPM